MMARIYKQIIKPVLEDKIQEMIKYMEEARIDYSVNTKDNFKIAMVGGFCNFYLTQKQVEDLFSKGADDRRFKDIIRDKSECEKAISFGAALIANDIIGFKQVAPYSLGIADADGKKYFAIKIGDDIVPGKPVKVENGCIFAGNKIPAIAFNFFADRNMAQSGEVLEKHKDKLELEKDKPMQLAFSFDESYMITLHKYVVDYRSNVENPRIVSEKSVQLDDFYELFGELVKIGGQVHV
jgi:molecular chaperone DnaK (HSP70)